MTTRPPPRSCKVTEFTLTWGKEEGARGHRAGLQLLSST